MQVTIIRVRVSTGSSKVDRIKDIPVHKAVVKGTIAFFRDGADGHSA